MNRKRQAKHNWDSFSLMTSCDDTSVDDAANVLTSSMFLDVLGQWMGDSLVNPG